MQVKTMPPMKVLYFSTRTTFSGLDALAGTVALELYKEASDLQLLVSGPIYWFYFGADGKPETEFTLEIALPVIGNIQQLTNFKFKELPPFKCVSVLHEGDWDQLSQTYGKVIPWLLAEGMEMKEDNECREIYLNMDFEKKENNLTQVLIGIKL